MQSSVDIMSGGGLVSTMIVREFRLILYTLWSKKRQGVVSHTIALRIDVIRDPNSDAADVLFFFFIGLRSITPPPLVKRRPCIVQVILDPVRDVTVFPSRHRLSFIVSFFLCK